MSNFPWLDRRQWPWLHFKVTAASESKANVKQTSKQTKNPTDFQLGVSGAAETRKFDQCHQIFYKTVKRGVNYYHTKFERSRPISLQEKTHDKRFH